MLVNIASTFIPTIVRLFEIELSVAHLSQESQQFSVPHPSFTGDLSDGGIAKLLTKHMQILG